MTSFRGFLREKQAKITRNLPVRLAGVVDSGFNSSAEAPKLPRNDEKFEVTHANQGLDKWAENQHGVELNSKSLAFIKDEMPR